MEVIGSQPEPLAAVAPQQLLPPLYRKAAWPYFSLTTFFMSALLMAVPLLFTKVDDILWFHCLVSRADLAYRCSNSCSASVFAVYRKRYFAANVHKLFIFEFLQVERKRGVWNVQLRLDIARHQAVRMCGQQQPHDSKSWLGSQRRKHVGVFATCPVLVLLEAVTIVQ